MEQQFILKMPEQLLGLDLSGAKLVRVSPTEAALTVKDAVYVGAICRLPTIVETHKDVDGKLYKISDVSTVVSVISRSEDMKKDKELAIKSEISRVEASGLTPPMTRVREWRRRAPSCADGIDKMLADLLREDARAVSVEILEKEQAESSEDLDVLAAEIEDDLEAAPSPVQPAVLSMSDIEGDAPAAAGKAVPKKGALAGREQPASRTAVGSPVADAAFNANFLVSPTLPSRSEASKQEQPPISEQPLSPAADIVANALQMPVFQSTHPELLELENKIKEKQELLDKALNPILKKRFSQALDTLKEEYNAKKKELGQ
ncbi:hypothetical protein PAPHI01_0900 [Pancytospora philotis]|nr:hypothetical protein PAPHI01_0900 [Pancytospora philotis]